MSKRRRGSMLIEQVALMGIGSTVFLIAMGLLHQTLHYKKTSQSRTDHTLATGRLVAQLRRDAMQCTEASCPTKEEVLLRTTNGTKIRFLAMNGIITREWISSSSSDIKPLSRESFTIGPYCALSFTTDAPFIVAHFEERSSYPMRSSIDKNESTGEWSVVARLGSSVIKENENVSGAGDKP